MSKRRWDGSRHEDGRLDRYRLWNSPSKRWLMCGRRKLWPATWTAHRRNFSRKGCQTTVHSGISGPSRGQYYSTRLTHHWNVQKEIEKGRRAFVGYKKEKRWHYWSSFRQTQLQSRGRGWSNCRLTELQSRHRGWYNCRQSRRQIQA